MGSDVVGTVWYSDQYAVWTGCEDLWSKTFAYLQTSSNEMTSIYNKVEEKPMVGRILYI